MMAAKGVGSPPVRNKGLQIDLALGNEGDRKGIVPRLMGGLDIPNTQLL